MAITGTLEADFSSFNAAVQSAEVKLQAFAGSSDKVAAALTRITDDVPPRMGTLAGSLGSVAGASGQALGPVNSLREVMGSFDGALAAVGVHVGPAVRGLSELGDASGKTIGQLGGVATAGLAVGVGMAAWTLTRKAMEFLELDAAVSKAWQSLLGWGDAAQVAGAKQDTINKAIRDGADANISYADAIVFNTAHLTEWEIAAQKADDALKRLTAPAESAKQIAGWQAEIDLVKSSGVIASLTADLDSHNFSLSELSSRYRISVGGLQEFGRELKANDDIVKNNTKLIDAAQKQLDAASAKRVQAAKAIGDAEEAAAKRWAAGMAELTAAGKGWKGVLDTIDGSVVEAIKGYLAMNVSQETLMTQFGLTAIQLRAIAEAYREETEAHKKSNDENKRGTETGTKTTATLAKQVELVHTLAGEYISLAAAQKLHEMGGSATIPDLTPAQVEMMGGRAEIERQVALGRPQNPGTTTAEGYADLARRQAAFEAMVRYLASLSYTSNVTPNLPASVTNPLGSSPPVNVNITVSGVMDPRTIEALSRGVSDEIMRTARLGRRF